MRSESIERIGFFHCVRFENSFAPITALGRALTDRIGEETKRDHTWSINNSLIVLPEAFNIGQYPPGINSAPSQQDGRAEKFLKGLGELAKRHRIVFVTGVLDDRKNSAYAVGAAGPRLMCHKVGEDETYAYDPHTGNPDPCNPITFRNACVGALVCMDAANANDILKSRREDLGKRLNASIANRIVCLPACFNRNPPESLDIFPDLSNCWYVLADQSGKPNAKSCIADSLGRTIIEALDDNEVRIWDLPRQPNRKGKYSEQEGI